MTIFLNTCLLMVGFALLIKGADWLVDGASSIAMNFKIPKTIIGLTIVAFGTSAPELAVSFQALRTNSVDLTFGNVIGSGVLNVFLLIGLAALVRPISVKDITIKAELPICLLITCVFMALINDLILTNGTINMFSKGDAVVMLLVFGVFLNYTIRSALKHGERYRGRPQFGVLQSILLVIVGLVGLVFGSDLVVDSSVEIANIIGLSERLIALTIIAFGTSLPELVTTIVSSRKGEQDLIIGNIIGSNIFNMCIVLTIPVLVYGNMIPSEVNLLDCVMVILAADLLFVFAIEGRVITRLNGLIMLGLFLLYYFLVLAL